MNTMGEKIAELRKSKSMTQEELAARIGVSLQAISRWENSATMPDIMLLPVIANILDITIDELFSADKTTAINGQDFDVAPKKSYMSVLLFPMMRLAYQITNNGNSWNHFRG